MFEQRSAGMNCASKEQDKRKQVCVWTILLPKFTTRNFETGRPECSGKMQDMRDRVLNDDVLEDYLSETVDSDMPVMCSLVRETLSKFIEYLVLQSEYRFCDFIISCIEDYPEAMYQELVTKAKERKKQCTVTLS